MIKLGEYNRASAVFYAPSASKEGMNQIKDANTNKVITGSYILDEIERASLGLYASLGGVDEVQATPYAPLDGASLYSSIFFTDAVDEGRKRGYNNREITDKDRPTLEAFKGGWFSSLCEYGSFMPDFQDSISYEAITEITELYKSEESAYQIGINEYDLPTVKKQTETWHNQERRTFLLRFAVTDYYFEKSERLFIEAENFGGSVYGSVQTAFLNLNVLSLTMEKDGVESVIPVSANPIDVMADPTTSEKEDMFLGILDMTVPKAAWDMFKKAFDALGQIAIWALAIVIVIVVYKFVKWIWNKTEDRRKERKAERKRMREEARQDARRDAEDERKQARKKKYEVERENRKNAREDERERRKEKKRYSDFVRKRSEDHVRSVDRLNEYEEKKKIDEKYRNNGKKKDK